VRNSPLTRIQIVGPDPNTSNPTRGRKPNSIRNHHVTTRSTHSVPNRNLGFRHARRFQTRGPAMEGSAARKRSRPETTNGFTAGGKRSRGEFVDTALTASYFPPVCASRCEMFTPCSSYATGSAGFYSLYCSVVLILCLFSEQVVLPAGRLVLRNEMRFGGASG
jgi:hypothetical protein